MFSSNRRRASTVSEAETTGDDDVVLDEAGAHAATATIATKQADENLVDSIRLCGEVPKSLTSQSAVGDSGCPLLTDDLLENRDAAREIRPVHHQWRQQAQRVLTSSERQ